MGSSHEEGVHAVSSGVVHWSRLAHRGGSVGTTGGERSSKGGGDLRCEDGGRWRENELLRNDAKKSLSEACKESKLCARSYVEG
jgi:hypothetical protein